MLCSVGAVFSVKFPDSSSKAVKRDFNALLFMFAKPPNYHMIRRRTHRQHRDEVLPSATQQAATEMRLRCAFSAISTNTVDKGEKVVSLHSFVGIFRLANRYRTAENRKSAQRALAPPVPTSLCPNMVLGTGERQDLRGVEALYAVRIPRTARALDCSPVGWSRRTAPLPRSCSESGTAHD